MRFTLTEESIDKTKFIVIRPENNISDAEYDRIKPFMENMGGHWRERVKGFIFPKEAVKRSNYAQWKEDTQFFPTPDALAKRAVELSGINNSTDELCILEPSAGRGSLLRALTSNIKQKAKFYIVEPEISNANILESSGFIVDRCTFEDFYERHRKKQKDITNVIMNPPFSCGRDIKHTMMAYELLVSNGVLVSIISENALYYENDESNKFKEWLKENNAYIEEVPYGTFRNSGTTVDTVIIKMIKE